MGIIIVLTGDIIYRNSIKQTLLELRTSSNSIHDSSATIFYSLFLITPYVRSKSDEWNEKIKYSKAEQYEIIISHIRIEWNWKEILTLNTSTGNSQHIY